MRRFALLVLVAALALVGPALGQFSVLELKNSLAQFALRQISVDGVFEITAGGVEEPRDGVTELVDIEIADAEGVWFRAEALSVRWDPSRILSGELELNELTIRAPQVLRQPVSTEVTVNPDAEIAQAPPRGLFDWPRAPIPVRVENLRVERAFLAAGVLAEQPLAFNAEGDARDEGDEQSLTLALARLDDVGGTVAIDYLRDFAAETVRLDVEAEEAAGGVVAEMLGLPEDSASRISLHADGPIDDWALSLDAEAERVLMVTAEASVHALAPVRATAELRLRPGSEAAPNLVAALGDEARLDIDVEEAADGVITVRQAEFSSPALSARVSGAYSRSDEGVALEVGLTARAALAQLVDGVSFQEVGFDGGVFGSLSALQARGVASVSVLETADFDVQWARVNLSLDSAENRASATADGQADGVRIDRITPEILGPATLSVRASSDGDALSLDALRLETRLLTAEFDGALNLGAETAALRYSVTAPRLGPVAEAYDVRAAGALTARGTVHGPISALEAAGEARIDGLVYAGIGLGDVVLEHAARLGENPAGRLTLSGDGGEIGPIALDAEFQEDGGSIAVSDLEARLFGAELSGAARISPASGLVSGGLRLSSQDLSAAGRAFDLELGGDASGALRLTHDGVRQDLAAELSGARLDIDAVGFEAWSASLGVEDLTDAAELRASLRAGSLDLGAARLKGASIDVEGALGADPLRLSVTRLTAGEGEAEIRLQAALIIVDEAGETKLDGLDLLVAGARLTGAAVIHEDGVSGDVRLATDRLDDLARLIEAPVSMGALDAEARFDTRPDSAFANISATASNLGMRDLDEAGAPLALRLEADWNGRVMTAEAFLTGPFAEPLAARAEFALRPDGLLPAPPPDTQLEGAVKWRGRVEELWDLLPFPDHILTGALDVDLRFSGPLASPRVSGRLALASGSYQNLEAGALISDLSARSRIDPSGDWELTVTATDSAGAAINASVSIRAGAIDGRLTTRNAVLIRRDDIVAALTAEIRATGPLSAPRIAGDVVVERAEIRLIDDTPPSIADLGEIQIAGAPPPERPKAPSAGGPTLDLRVRAPDSIFVRGRGLDSEWRADLTVTGPVASPQIGGSVQAVRGRLSLVGRTFELVRGRMVFLRASPPDPSVDIVFERESTDLTGRIRLSGYLSAPEIGFSSAPQLPEDEVLPRVLFGKSRQSLSPSQALELAAGVATLLGGGEGVLGRVRSAIGLDVLSIDEQDGASALTAGRSVGDGVFVGVKQPLDGSAASVVVEVEIFDEVTVDSEVSQDGGASVGVNWKRDF